MPRALSLFIVTFAAANPYIFLCLDKPYCNPDQKKFYGASSGHPVEIRCEVKANPSSSGGIRFEWSINSTTNGNGGEDASNGLKHRILETEEEERGDGSIRTAILKFTPRVSEIGFRSDLIHDRANKLA